METQQNLPACNCGVKTDAVCTVSLEGRQASPLKNDREPCVSWPLGLRVGTSSSYKEGGRQEHSSNCIGQGFRISKQCSSSYGVNADKPCSWKTLSLNSGLLRAKSSDKGGRGVTPASLLPPLHSTESARKGGGGVSAFLEFPPCCRAWLCSLLVFHKRSAFRTAECSC